MELLKSILIILFMIGILVLALYIKGMKMRKAHEFIIQELKNKQAFDPTSAVVLPYTKTSPLNVGFRDYRPTVLRDLVTADVVRMTEDKRFYLREEYKLKADA